MKNKQLSNTTYYKHFQPNVMVSYLLYILPAEPLSVQCYHSKQI